MARKRASKSSRLTLHDFKQYRTKASKKGLTVKTPVTSDDKIKEFIFKKIGDSKVIYKTPTITRALKFIDDYKKNPTKRKTVKRTVKNKTKITRNVYLPNIPYVRIRRAGGFYISFRKNNKWENLGYVISIEDAINYLSKKGYKKALKI